MAKTLHYLIDPLCGWCYGATPAVSALRATHVEMRLRPTRELDAPETTRHARYVQASTSRSRPCGAAC